MNALQTLKEFFARLTLSRSHGTTPPDLQEFNEARQRLGRTTRAFTKQIDTFGDMAIDMARGANGRKPHKKKPCAKKTNGHGKSRARKK